MNESHEITLLRDRSVQARAMAGQARRVGSQEQQISAYCLAEALELRLEQLLNTDAIGAPTRPDRVLWRERRASLETWHGKQENPPPESAVGPRRRD